MNNVMQRKLCGPKGLLHDAQQLPVPVRQTNGEGGKTEKYSHPFVVVLLVCLPLWIVLIFLFIFLSFILIFFLKFSFCGECYKGEG